MLSYQTLTQTAVSDIAGVEIVRADIPLITPYRLSFGPQTHFHCVFVRVLTAAGHEGWGEAALLPGYTDETPDESWSLAETVAADLAGVSGEAALARLDRTPPKAAFTATAFRTAMEHAASHPALARSGRVELLGVVNAKPTDRAAFEAEITRLIEAGFRTLKVKVGWTVDDDIAAVAAVQKAVAGRARIRIDGNQGYGVADALRFLDALDAEGVELVEQLCAAGDWDAAVTTAQAAGAPLMLDESIYGEDDIRKAATLDCADFIKLKLMKMGGLDALDSGLRLIRELKMQPVLGNGVATDLGCWMEACVAVETIDNGGEMNGFLKPHLRLLEPVLKMDGAAILLDGERRTVNRAVLDDVTLARRRYGRTD